jgi:hypothetical protein
MLGRDFKAWKDKVRSYRDKLEISEHSFTAAGYKKILDMELQRYVEDPDFEVMQLGTQITLESKKVFEQWMAYQGSSALLITAVNHPNSGLQQEFWLSRLACSCRVRKFQAVGRQVQSRFPRYGERRA